MAIQANLDRASPAYNRLLFCQQLLDVSPSTSPDDPLRGWMTLPL